MPKRKRNENVASTSKVDVGGKQVPGKQLAKKQYSLKQAQQLVFDSVSDDDEATDIEEMESESEASVHSTSDDTDTVRQSASSIRIDDGWDRNVRVPDSTFKPTETIGPRSAASGCSADNSALDFFSLFWTADLWDLIVDRTNLNAFRVKAAKPNDYYAKKWTPLTVPELKAFIGLRLSMEYSVIKRRYEFYFSRNSGMLFHTPFYRKVMCRDRFLALWKFFHIVDEEDANVDKQDKLYKVRFLLNRLIAKFQENYKPDQDLSLDEGMIPSKNRLSIKQYISNKPVKWGIKCFMLCESKTGYVCNIEVYVGKSSGLFVPELGSTGSVVARLTSIVQDQNYRVYMDRFYNSPSLCQYLLEKKIFCCGTVLTHRKGYPKALIKRKKDMVRGDFDFLCSTSTAGLCAVVWCDRRPLYFISSFHDPRQITSVNRKNKDGSVVQVNCPSLVSSYTQNMGGCDTNDQVTKLYRVRKHYRWPRRMVMKCLTWTCYNAYVVRNVFKGRIIPGKRIYTFYDFVDAIVMELIGDYRTTNPVRKRSAESMHVQRLQLGQHFPDRPQDATGNNRCAVCREKARKFSKANPAVAKKGNPHKETKTVFRCQLCDTYLCIRAGSSCWDDYHTKVQFWR